MSNLYKILIKQRLPFWRKWRICIPVSITDFNWWRSYMHKQNLNQYYWRRNDMKWYLGFPKLELMLSDHDHFRESDLLPEDDARPNYVLIWNRESCSTVLGWEVNIHPVYFGMLCGVFWYFWHQNNIIWSSLGKINNILSRMQDLSEHKNILIIYLPANMV